MGPRIAALVVLALACGTAAASRHLASAVHGDGHEPRYQLPTGVKVRALVFYGRLPRFAAIIRVSQALTAGAAAQAAGPP
jgi:hypothetical protein